MQALERTRNNGIPRVTRNSKLQTCKAAPKELFFLEHVFTSKGFLSRNHADVTSRCENFSFSSSFVSGDFSPARAMKRRGKFSRSHENFNFFLLSHSIGNGGTRELWSFMWYCCGKRWSNLVFFERILKWNLRKMARWKRENFSFSIESFKSKFDLEFEAVFNWILNAKVNKSWYEYGRSSINCPLNGYSR